MMSKIQMRSQMKMVTIPKKSVKRCYRCDGLATW